MMEGAGDSAAKTLAIRWLERAVPLSPSVAVADNRNVAAALLQYVLNQQDATLAGWSGVFSPESTIVALLAPRRDSPPLPWVDGVRYFGCDTSGPSSMFLPTNQQASLPAALVYRALRSQLADVAEPFALWPSIDGAGVTLLPLSDARPLDRNTVGEVLQRIAKGAQVGVTR